MTPPTTLSIICPYCHFAHDIPLADARAAAARAMGQANAGKTSPERAAISRANGAKNTGQTRRNRTRSGPP